MKTNHRMQIAIATGLSLLFAIPATAALFDECKTLRGLERATCMQRSVQNWQWVTTSSSSSSWSSTSLVSFPFSVPSLPSFSSPSSKSKSSQALSARLANRRACVDWHVAFMKQWSRQRRDLVREYRGRPQELLAKLAESHNALIQHQKDFHRKLREGGCGSTSSLSSSRSSSSSLSSSLSSSSTSLSSSSLSSSVSSSLSSALSSSSSSVSLSLSSSSSLSQSVSSSVLSSSSHSSSSSI